MSKSFSERLSQASIEARERPVFEGWVKTAMPACWPNPSDEGAFIFPECSEFAGQYFNRLTNYMWQSWLARALCASLQNSAPIKDSK